MLDVAPGSGQQKLVQAMYRVLGSAQDGDIMNEPKTQNNRYNLRPETLQDLQQSLYDWQLYNFGDQDNELVLMGICEEAGELQHSYLKLEQGIRGTTAEHEAGIRDAVGDIMIYLLNYMSGLGEKIQVFVPREDVEKPENPKVIRQSVLSVFRMVGRVADDPKSMSRIGHLITALIYLCALKGWDLETVTRETWAQVGRRDWRQFPDTGFAPGLTGTPEMVQQQPTQPEQIPPAQAAPQQPPQG